MTTRREILSQGAAVAAAAAPLAAMARVVPAPQRGGEGGAFPYDYLFVEVPQRSGRLGGAAPFLAHLRSAGAAAIAVAGGDILGYFTPLIGWSSEQLAVMIRWPEPSSPDRERAVRILTQHPTVRKVERSVLAPTLRPAPMERPKITGIYTHRWFDIRTPDLAEFIDLSGQAWPDFEREFDAAIFGLFRARSTIEEGRRGVTRMLLNTQYASHAVWEASRVPSSGAAGLFRRRSDLTLTTRVVSLHFTALGGG